MERIGAAELANQISIDDGLSIVAYTLVDVGFGNATTALGFPNEYFIDSKTILIAFAMKVSTMRRHFISSKYWTFVQLIDSNGQIVQFC